jgi:hypothetical protein
LRRVEDARDGGVDLGAQFGGLGGDVVKEDHWVTRGLSFTVALRVCGERVQRDMLLTPLWLCVSDRSCGGWKGVSASAVRFVFDYWLVWSVGGAIRVV